MYIVSFLRNHFANTVHLLSANYIFLIQPLIYLADESQLVADENNVWFENTLYGTKPVVIHGNGPSKVQDILYACPLYKWLSLDFNIKAKIKHDSRIFPRSLACQIPQQNL